MEPRTRDGVLIDDARSIGRLLPRSSVTTTITSPPYGRLKDYGTISQIGFTQSEKQYFVDLAEVFRGCFKVTRSRGTLWVVVDRTKEGGKAKMLPWRLSDLIEGVGWSLADVIVWDKQKSLPYPSRLGLRHQFEYVLMFSKGGAPRTFPERIRDPFDLPKWWRRYPERHHPKGTAPTDIWTFRIPTQGEWGKTYVKHMCPFPPELVERILLLTTNHGDLVLDPFAGSGVVPGVANLMGRRYFGTEINEGYVREFHRSVMPGLIQWWNARSKERARRSRFLAWREGETWKMRQLKLAALVARAVSQLPVPEQARWIAVRPGRSMDRTRITLHSEGPATEAMKTAGRIVNTRPGSWFELRVTLANINGRRPNGGYWAYDPRSFLWPLGRVRSLDLTQANGSPRVLVASPLVPDEVKSRQGDRGKAAEKGS